MATKPQIDPKKVKSLLEAEAETPLNLSEETTQRLKAAAQENLHKADVIAEAETSNAEDTRSKIFDEDQETLSSLASWAMDINKLHVEVTELEKALYLKAVINDEEIVLPITLANGITFSFRPLINYDMDVVNRALQLDQTEGLITGPAQYASYIQYYAAALQIKAINGQPRNAVTFNQPWPDTLEAAEQLRANVNEDIKKWTWPKWRAAVTALRIFEAKLALCNQNADNGNFWNPADAD